MHRLTKTFALVIHAAPCVVKAISLQPSPMSEETEFCLIDYRYLSVGPKLFYHNNIIDLGLT